MTKNVSVFDRLFDNYNTNEIKGLKMAIVKNRVFGMSVPAIMSKYNDAGLLLYVSADLPGVSPARRVGSHLSEVYPDELVVALNAMGEKAKAKPRTAQTVELKSATKAGEAIFRHELVYIGSEFTLISTLVDFR